MSLGLIAYWAAAFVIPLAIAKLIDSYSEDFFGPANRSN
jgi:hypothetical protein